MDLEKAINKILQKSKSHTDAVIALSFVREPFSEDFRNLVGLQDDAAYVKAFESFTEIAHRSFSWNDYLDARTTAEKSFRTFYQSQHYPEDDLEEAVNGFIVSFFNQNIDEHQYQWEDAHPGEEMPEPPEDDIDNLFLSRVFPLLSCKEGDEAFCEGIGVYYHYEQLHMCCWFSSQITNGGGQYSRDQVNYSARTTYNRLLNPYSLLWIGFVMGADRETLTAAAAEMESRKTAAAKCGVVRKYVPFDEILRLYQKMMMEEEA